MAKKPLKPSKPLGLISTLILSLGLCSTGLTNIGTLRVRALDDPTATGQTETQTQFATDLLSRAAEFQAQIIGDCDAGMTTESYDESARMACRLENYERLLNEDAIFRAYANLREQPFVITSFVPSSGDLFFTHFSLKMSDILKKNTEATPRYVTDFAVFWGEGTTLSDWDSYDEDSLRDLFLDLVPGAHKSIYSVTYDITYPQYALSAISGQSYNPADKNPNELAIFVSYDRGENFTKIMLPLRHCLDNGYEGGYCRLVVNGDGTMEYLPYQKEGEMLPIEDNFYPELPDPTPEPEPTPDPDPEPDPEPEPEPQPDPDPDPVDPHAPDAYEEFTLPESTHAADNYPYTIVNGHFVWDYLDLMELNEVYEADLDTCNGNTYCEEALQEARRNEHPMYQALMTLRNRGLRLLAVSPSLGSVTLSYDDTPDIWSRRYHYNNDLVISDLYLYFLDDTAAESDTPRYNWEYTRIYSDALKANSPLSGQHQLLNYDLYRDGISWIPAKNGTTYPVTNLADNTSGLLYAWAGAISSDPNYIDPTMAVETWDYSACLSHADYQSGMECRRVVSNDGYASYLPFWPGERLTAPAPQTITETIPVASDPIIKTEYIYAPVASQGTANVTENVKTTENPVETADKASEDSVELPLAGDNIQIVEKTIFPWWLVALLIAGDVIVMWWFLPSRKNRKS